MSDGDVSPPTRWYEADECPVRDCEVTKFVPLAMDLHILREHETDDTGPRPVAEQIDSGVRR